MTSGFVFKHSVQNVRLCMQTKHKCLISSSVRSKFRVRIRVSHVMAI